jgi:WbqC-like protein family
MRVTIHQPQFLPWLGYVDKIDQSDLFVVLDTVQFKKNEWQNRNRIRTAQGWQWLTVPVLQKFGQVISEVCINERVGWPSKHRRAFEMHYAHAPLSGPYLQGLQEIYDRPWERLSDLNVAVIRWLLAAFGITTPLRLASELDPQDPKMEATDRLIEICRSVGADTYLAGPGAHDYMDTSRFKKSGIGFVIQEFHHPIYPQCYAPFVPAMAAVDLLFNCGEGALRCLREARASIGAASG